MALSKLLGYLGAVALYENAAQLATETDYSPPGTMVLIIATGQLAMAQYQPSGADITTSTGTDPLGNAHTLYWAPVPMPMTPFYCTCVVTSLAAYTGSTTGTLTASAVGAFGTQDGITTLAAGSTVFIQPGQTNLTAASDAGPWVIKSLGSASTLWVLVRPSWWQTGTLPAFQDIRIGSGGSVYYNTKWRATNFGVVSGRVVDNGDAGLYCGKIQVQVQLAAGLYSFAAGTLPIGLMTQAQILCSSYKQGGTLTGTVSYGTKGTGFGTGTAFAYTPGYFNTSASEVYALATAQATQTSDTSTLTVTFDNGF